MKVELLKNGEIAEVNEGYGLRLLEQGKAVIYKEPPIMQEPVEPEAEPESKPKGGRSRKGE